MGFEGLLVLLGIVAIAVPFIVIGLCIGFANQKKRIGDLESRISGLQHRVDGLQSDRPVPVTAKTPEPKSTPDKSAAAAIQSDGTDDAKITGAAAPIAPPPVPPAPTSGPVPRATPPLSTPSRSTPPRPSPLRDALAKFGPWLQENWFYAVSALSLALAGIFLVQYGMENGLLPPRARVAAALAFGAALIGVGEYIRRRFGDHTDATTAYLPSVFSGAGIVTLFGGILSARMLYDLIGGGAAMGGMVVVAVIALVLGWLYGPLLAAIGIIGAYGAPIVLSSSNSDASPLFGYFAIIAVLGLGVDTIRRWGWVSVLTLVLAFLMGWLLLSGSGSNVDWAAILYFAALPVMAILIPARGVFPDHGGATVTRAIMSGRKGKSGLVRPIFPTLLAVATVAAGTVSLIPFVGSGEIEVWMALAALMALAVLLILWSARAPALQDIAVIPTSAVLLFVWLIGVDQAAPVRAFRATYTDTSDAAFPFTATLLVLAGALLSLCAAWRSLQGGRARVIWAGAAALIAPAMAILMEVSWNPSAVIGAYPWALHAAALAALMVAMAERFARVDGPKDRLRTSFAVIAALSSMAFAFVIVLSSAALTVALAVTVVAAAALDRNWKLPPLSLFVAAGVVTLGYRLIVDPGLGWGQRAPLAEMLLAYGGTLAAFLAGLWLLKPLRRPMAKVMLDSAAWSTGGTLISLLLFRWINQFATAQSNDSHWAMGLMSAIWLGIALAQLERTELGGRMGKLRWGLAGVFGLIGLGSLLLAVTASNPLFSNYYAANRVIGPPLFNTMIAAYVLPALVLIVGAVRLPRLDKRLRLGFVLIAAGLGAMWAGMVIRHFWRGAADMALFSGFNQGELYTYTIVLLGLGGGLFYQSLASHNAPLRKAGLVVIGLAVAKVFLIDISGLDGLTRVFSLLVLGLSLAGLAWLNRWAKDRDGSGAAPQSPPAVPPAVPEDI